MAKRVSDIFIENKKRRIEISRGDYPARPAAPRREPPRKPPKPPRDEWAPEPKRRRWGYYLAAVLGLAVFFFALSFFFVGATVTAYPKQKIVTIDQTVQASKDGPTPLHFETLELSDKESLTSTATGQKEVRKKASGTIIVYNAYNGNSQKLIKNTRFETIDGKIYRIDAPIVVPGVHLEDGKSVPGSVEAMVYADEPGKEYNIGKTDFTLPGFKGTDRYTKFYARSKTDMRGGDIGLAYTISDEDAKAAEATLRQRLNEKLTEAVKQNIPPGFIFYSNSGDVEYGELLITGGGDSKQVTVTEEARLHALIWSRDSLAKLIAQATIRDFDGSPVTSPSLDTLALTVKNKDTVDFETPGTISVRLAGPATIVWTFDEGALKNDLRGKQKSAFQSVLGKYRGIDRAELSLTPFWARSLPGKADDIAVRTVVR